MSKICCFTGSRHIVGITPKEVVSRLDAALVDLIENQGFTDFRAGGAVGFDAIAALRVLALKEKYPHIKLHIFIPCKNQDRYFSSIDKKVYGYILKHADSTVLVNEHYTSAAMHARNRAMVDGSDACVALLLKLSGGTYSTVRYARQKGVKVINLAYLK